MRNELVMRRAGELLADALAKVCGNAGAGPQLLRIALMQAEEEIGRPAAIRNPVVMVAPLSAVINGRGVRIAVNGVAPKEGGADGRE